MQGLKLFFFSAGLGFRPIPDVQTTLVRFVKADASTYSPYTDHIQAYLECKFAVVNTSQGAKTCFCHK